MPASCFLLKYCPFCVLKYLSALFIAYPQAHTHTRAAVSGVSVPAVMKILCKHFLFLLAIFPFKKLQPQKLCNNVLPDKHIYIWYGCLFESSPISVWGIPGKSTNILPHFMPPYRCLGWTRGYGAINYIFEVATRDKGQQQQQQLKTFWQLLPSVLSSLPLFPLRVAYL